MDKEFISELYDYAEFSPILREIDRIYYTYSDYITDSSSLGDDILKIHSIELEDAFIVVYLFLVLILLQFDPAGNLKYRFKRIASEFSGTICFNFAKRLDEFTGFSAPSVKDFRNFPEILPAVMGILFNLRSQTDLSLFVESILRERFYFFSSIYLDDSKRPMVRGIAAKLYSAYINDKMRVYELFDGPEGSYVKKPVSRFKQINVNEFDVYSYYGSMPIPSEFCRMKAGKYFKPDKILKKHNNPIAGYKDDPFRDIGIVAKYDYLAGRMIKLGESFDKIIERSFNLRFVIIHPVAGLFQRELLDIIPLVFTHFFSEYVPDVTSINLKIIRGNSIDGFSKYEMEFDTIPLIDCCFLSDHYMNSYFLHNMNEEPMDRITLKKFFEEKSYIVINSPDSPGLEQNMMKSLLNPLFCMGNIELHNDDSLLFKSDNMYREELLKFFDSHSQSFTAGFYDILRHVSSRIIRAGEMEYV